MGLQQYKVLYAMQERQDFTVDELFEATGVNKNSIYSILNRNLDKVDQIESIDTGRPGGKLKRFRVKPESAQEIREQLNVVFSELPVFSFLPSESDQAIDVPAGLDYAEDIYLRRIPSAEKDNDVGELKRLHKLANRSLDNARHEFSEIKGSHPNDRLELDEIELRFDKVESLNKSYERTLNYITNVEPFEETSAEAIEEIEEEAIEEIRGFMIQIHADLSHLELAAWEEPFEREKISRFFTNKLFNTFLIMDASLMSFSRIFDIFSEQSILFSGVRRLKRRFEIVKRNLAIVGLGREIDSTEPGGKILVNGKSANYL